MIRYLALASDYDGTLAHHGVVEETTLEAVRRLKASGRKFILVTGRILPELRQAFPEVELCDLVVAENGALIWNPATRAEILLAAAPPAGLVSELRRRGVDWLEEGRVIVATRTPHETAVFEVIRDLGLEMQVVFNKGAVMILPSGVNKATGLQRALEMLGLSPHNVVGVGDAENDHTLLQVCEAGVAVQNALETLREGADLVTAAPHGRGVTELIDSLLRDDLADLAPARHAVEIGEGGGGVRVGLPPSGASVLIAGTSGGGKSTLAASILERLTAQRYQYCLIDPEGDHAAQENAVILGSPRGAPEIAEVMTALAKPEQNCVVNLVGISIGERPPYFEKLLLGLLDLRHRTGRPHWLILDEAHHVLPGARGEAADASSPPMPGVLMITVEPEEIAGPALAGVDFILAIGDPARVLASFGRAAGEPAPAISARRLEQGEAMIWRCHPPGEPCVFRAFPPTRTRRRHSRKYAEGDVRDSSFFFRGPEGKLNLRAQNLMVFLQIAEGLDAETWDFHLRRGDYEKWFRDIIKDPELADFAASQAVTNGDSGGRSREAIREKIRERYTAPA